jgi:hypothetical protein
VRGCLALARIRDSLPLEVPISNAARHEFAHDSAHRADDNFLVSGDDSEARTRLFYEKLERRRLDVGAVGREVRYAA